MKILITAGPTREPIDPVRYLGNRSSGKMGYTLATAAIQAGHEVILVSGPVSLDIPEYVDYVPVETAADMYEAVAYHLPGCDAGIFAAAVADYTPRNPLFQKLKKGDQSLQLELVRTRDILGSCRSTFNFQGYLIGFAAETENVIENARYKLEKKACNFIVANDVSQPGIGFESAQNEITFVFPKSIKHIPRDDKSHLAHVIIHELEKLASTPENLS